MGGDTGKVFWHGFFFSSVHNVMLNTHTLHDICDPICNGQEVFSVTQSNNIPSLVVHDPLGCKTGVTPHR